MTVRRSLVAHTVTRTHVALMRSRLRRVCDLRPVVWCTEPFLQMTRDDVLDVLDVLAQASVPASLAGGWGVDALLGGQTRVHHDLDVFVPDGHPVRDATGALTALDLHLVAERPPSGLMPRRVVLADGRGRMVDLLPVDLARPPLGSASGDDAPAFSYGELDGRRVMCASLGLQLRLHDHRALSRAGRADVGALRARGRGLQRAPA